MHATHDLRVVEPSGCQARTLGVSGLISGRQEPAADMQAAVAARLRDMYQDFNHHNKKNPLDELIFILGSTRTPERSYRATFHALKEKFPRFRDLAIADVESIAEPLFYGGMYRQKARMLRDILELVTERFGRPTLAPLRRMDDAECERVLTSLPGVGKKIARCVMMYSLGRQVFPVDTHCWRICRRLGWIKARGPGKRPSQKDMDRLEALIRPELRFSLHVNMVSHGRACCTALNPKCDRCVIADLCPKIGVSNVGIEIEGRAAKRNSAPHGGALKDGVQVYTGSFGFPGPP